MEKTELNDSLQFLIDENDSLEVLVYAILKNIAEPKKLDIKSDDLPEISKMFVDAVKSQIIDQTKHTILPLSSADERGNCFYLYDLELPEELTNLEKVIIDDDLDTFDFRNNKLEEIDSIIIVLVSGDNEISIYKKVSSVEILGRGGYVLGRANQRLERFNDQLLRISPRFQVIRINGDIIILDLNTIEKSFGFQEVIKREATISLNAIEEMSIVSEMDCLREMIDDISFARKLTKVAKSSPVIKLKISNSDIISFSKKHPSTKNMKYTDNDTKFDLNTKVSKDLFLKLLNDDLLTSELTKLYYASLAKDGVKSETDIESNVSDVSVDVAEIAADYSNN